MLWVNSWNSFTWTFYKRSLNRKSKKIEQEREHYLKGLDTVMTYAKMYYVPLFMYAYSTAIVLKTAKNERERKYAFFLAW